MKKIVLALLILFPLNVDAVPSYFSDVDSNTPYSRSIRWMYEEGALLGYPDGTFKPDKCVNRVEMVKMGIIMSELGASDSGSASRYSDVDMDAWYIPYLNSATDFGIIEGYPDGTFKPDGCVNRVEAVKIAILSFVSNVDDVPPYDNPYVDIDADAWYKQYLDGVLWANMIGLKHVDDQLFFPAGDMTRKEVAELLYRIKAVFDNSHDKYQRRLEPLGIGERGSPYLFELMLFSDPLSTDDEIDVNIGDEIRFTAVFFGADRVTFSDEWVYDDLILDCTVFDEFELSCKVNKEDDTSVFYQVNIEGYGVIESKKIDINILK